MSGDQHVVPHVRNWAVISEGSQRPTSIHPTQLEAIDAARQIARTQHCELLIHGRDGRVRDSDSYKVP